MVILECSEACVRKPRMAYLQLFKKKTHDKCEAKGRGVRTKSFVINLDTILI